MKIQTGDPVATSIDIDSAKLHTVESKVTKWTWDGKLPAGSTGTAIRVTKRWIGFDIDGDIFTVARPFVKAVS